MCALAELGFEARELPVSVSGVDRKRFRHKWFFLIMVCSLLIKHLFDHYKLSKEIISVNRLIPFLINHLVVNNEVHCRLLVGMENWLWH